MSYYDEADYALATLEGDSTMKRTMHDMRTNSDCLRCCIATILHMKYEDVPDFVADHHDWFGPLVNWCITSEISIVRVQATGDGELLHSVGRQTSGCGEWIASGPANRARNHAVLYKGPVMIHDPYSSREGLLAITAALFLSC